MKTRFELLKYLTPFLIVSFFACSFAQAGEEVSQQKIINEEVINQFSVEGGAVKTSIGRHDVSVQNKDNFVSVLKEHGVVIDNCAYEITISKKTLNLFFPETEDHVEAFMFDVTFLNCKDEELKAAKIGGVENKFSPTMVAEVKAPTTFYFNGTGNKLELFVMHGMYIYHDSISIDVKSIFDE